MKKFNISLLTAITFIIPSLTHAHGAHTKHKMILMGESEIFASHIVYNEPHNFQVLLQLNLN